MKNRRHLLNLLDQFLKTSPRSKAISRAAILPPEYRPTLAKIPSDQQFVKNFIINLNVSYMYNYYGPPTIAQQKMFLHKKTFVNPLSVGLTRRKAIEINDAEKDKKTVLFELIKLLNKDKNTVLRYTELQQFLMKLSVSQTKEYKKFIVYLYKWLLNEKHTFPSNSIQYELCQDTSEIIIKKIYESHETGDYEILKNTEQELLTIETLEKAREMKRNGKIIEAREIYETVYFGRLTQEIDRVEALEFIIEKSKEQRDCIFLEKMVLKIKEGLGLKSHEKTFTRAIGEIKDLQTSLEQLSDGLDQGQEALQEIEQKKGLKDLLMSQKQPQKGQVGSKNQKILSEGADRGKNN